jgi:phosphonate transport system substrate-binding protein
MHSTKAIIAKLTLWCGLLALLTSTGPATAEELKELHFGIISTESTAGLKKSFDPWLAAMSKTIGIPVKGFYAPDYAGVIEAMRFNKVHIAWYGNKSAMEAVKRANGEICAQTVDVEGNPGYWSLIVAHQDSDLNSIDDIIAAGKSLKFGNGDPNSTSGYLIPTYYVWSKRGIDPNSHFGQVRNANHETNLMAVATKQVDFATNNTESLRRLEQKNPEMFQQIKVLWKSPLIPSDPLVWRKDLSREMKAKIKGFLLAYGRFGPNAEEERRILAATSSGWAPFNDSSNLQLLPIREISLVKDKLNIESNANMSDADKQAKIAAIDKQLADLAQYQELLEQFN